MLSDSLCSAKTTYMQNKLYTMTTCACMCVCINLHHDLFTTSANLICYCEVSKSHPFCTTEVLIMPVAELKERKKKKHQATFAPLHFKHAAVEMQRAHSDDRMK